MPQINSPTTPHRGPSAVGGWQWLPFSDASFLSHVRQALDIITTRISTQRDCDDAFRRLPHGRGFPDVWFDPTIWISFDPTLVGGRFGATLANEITLSQYACRMGAWTIVATLIHELAHVNGAGGSTNAAESVLNHCRMKEHFHPEIIGQVIRAPRAAIIAALNHSFHGRSRDAA